MRLTIFALMFAAATGAQAQTTPADCLIIDGLDTLHAVQTRLSRNNNDFLFRTDIRIMRGEFSLLSERNTLVAVDSSRLGAKGSAFIRFLRDTGALLQVISLDDPSSIQPHFTQSVRTNLGTIGRYLVEIRCEEGEIAGAEREARETASSSAPGESDDAAEILREAADALINFTNLFIFIGMVVTTVVGLRTFGFLVKRRKRRAKRHAVVYASEYGLDERQSEGVMIDINCFGCKLRHAENGPIAKGEVLDLQIEEEWVKGVVIWTNNHYIGLQFKKPISLQTVKTVCETLMELPKKKDGAQKDAA